MLDIGQGDCILAIFPSGKRLVIDCGSKTKNVDYARVREFIKAHCANHAKPSIDMLVVTHPDDDHYSEITKVFGPRATPNIAVQHITYVGTPGQYRSRAPTLPGWLTSFSGSESTVITGQEWNKGDPAPLPGFERDGVTVLAANVTDQTPLDSNPDNARSIVLLVSFGTGRALLAGDATDDTDSFIRARFHGNLQALDVDFWKAAHHGAWATATHSPDWASIIRPEIVVFPAGSGNTFGHPSITLAQQFSSFVTSAAPHPLVLRQGKTIVPDTEAKPFQNKAFYSTESSGDITITSTGGPFVLTGCSR